jgi:glutaredoxin
MITVYTSKACAYCNQVKKYLTYLNAEYQERNVDDDPDIRQEAIKMSGVMSTPITTNGNLVVVGFNAAKLRELI